MEEIYRQEEEKEVNEKKGKKGKKVSILDNFVM